MTLKLVVFKHHHFRKASSTMLQTVVTNPLKNTKAECLMMDLRVPKAKVAHKVSKAHRESVVLALTENRVKALREKADLVAQMADVAHLQERLRE